MKKLYVTRHGLTAYNGRGFYTGWTDIPLSEEGLAQARALAQTLPAGINAVVSSSLLRARQTAEICAGQVGVGVVSMEEFRERCAGELEGHTMKEAAARFPMLADSPVMYPAGFCPPGGESEEDVARRVFAGLTRLLRTYCREETVLLVCHGYTCREIHRLLTGTPREALYDFQPPNCRLLEYEAPRLRAPR